MIVRLPFEPLLTLQTYENAGPAPASLQIHLLGAASANREIYGLRYQGYRHAGHIGDIESQQYSDRYDALASTFQIGAFDGGRYIGGLRMCFSEPRQQDSSLPCEAVYPEAARMRKKAKGAVVELGRLALDPTLRNYSYRTTVYAALVRSALLVCKACDVEVLLAAAQPKWTLYYQRVLGFSVVGEPRLYPPGHEPIVLFSRMMGISSPARSGMNPFFKLKDSEVDEVRIKLAPLLCWRDKGAEVPMVLDASRGCGALEPHNT